MAEPAFACLACGTVLRADAYGKHLGAEPRHRAVVFEHFVADHADRVAAGTRCTGAVEILPHLDDEERARFGITTDRCQTPVLSCPCMGSFCAAHTFACASCGRFACLRHRWSARCPECAEGVRARPVKVEKYDPFSKQRSTFVRKYRRSVDVPPWPAIVAPPVDGSDQD